MLAPLDCLKATILQAIVYCCTNAIIVAGYIKSNRCYSCMSPLYEPLYREGFLSRYFYEPRNFTAQCDEPMQTSNVGLVPCRSICLTLTQDFIVMGRPTGKKLTIRGCAITISRIGFFNRTMALFDRYDICRDLKVSDLFRYETESQTVRVCSCLGDRCNAASHSGTTDRQLIVKLVFLIIYIGYCL